MGKIKLLKYNVSVLFVSYYFEEVFKMQ